MLIVGTIGDDTLSGSSDPDDILGLDGDDEMYGYGDNDSLYGGTGNDTLYGGDGDDWLDGRADDDIIYGGAGADTIVLRDGYGSDTVMDFDVAEDRVHLASVGVNTWADVQDRLIADFDGTAIIILDDGSSLRFEGLTIADLTEDNFILDPPPVCFVAGTLIDTPHGAIAVETLRLGDQVCTLDHGFQPLLWIGRRLTQFGHGPHHHQPIVIAAGAMGHGAPQADLRLSPQHRVLVQGGDGRQFENGALAKAKGLCGREGITQDTTCTAVIYLQLMLPNHAIVTANGLLTETFYPGAFAVGGLPDADRAAIDALFPGIADDPAAVYGGLARPVLSLRAITALSPAQAQTPTPKRRRAAA